jgi:hypothetical protein
MGLSVVFVWHLEGPIDQVLVYNITLSLHHFIDHFFFSRLVLSGDVLVLKPLVSHVLVHHNLAVVKEANVCSSAKQHRLSRIFL